MYTKLDFSIENIGIQWLFWLYLYRYPYTDHIVDFGRIAILYIYKLPLYGDQYIKINNVGHHRKRYSLLCYIMHHVFTYIGSGFNNQTGSILVHLYPLTYINLHVKYGSNPFLIKIQNMKTNYFSLGGGGGVPGPLYKIHGHRGHQNISKCRPHYSGEICTTSEHN